MKRRRLQGLLRPGHHAGRPRGGAARARRRRDEPRRDRRLHRVRQDLRRQGPGLDQGQRRRQGPRGPAVADREEPARRGAGRDHRAAPARATATCSSSAPTRPRSSTTRIGALRVKIGHSDFGKAHGLFEDDWAPLWVVDFPMFEYDEAAGRWNAVHHPFTAPKDGHEDWLDTDPGALHRQGLRHGAQRHGARRRLGAYPPRRGAEQGLPRAQDRRRGGAAPSSASCSTRCSTARRRTAASPSAWTASSR